MFDHLSYSAINEYCFCPHSFFLGRIEKLPRKSSTNMTIGTLVHHGIEGLLLDKLNNMEVFSQDPFDHINKLLQTEWSDTFWKNKRTQEEFHAYSQHDQDFINEEVTRILETQEIIDGFMSIEPSRKLHNNGGAVERELELWVDGVPIPIINLVDVFEEDGIPTDLKTSKKRWSLGKTGPGDAEKSIQPDFYLLAASQNGIKIPVKIQIPDYDKSKESCFSNNSNFPNTNTAHVHLPIDSISVGCNSKRSISNHARFHKLEMFT